MVTYLFITYSFITFLYSWYHCFKLTGLAKLCNMGVDLFQHIFVDRRIVKIVIVEIMFILECVVLDVSLLSSIVHTECEG